MKNVLFISIGIVLLMVSVGHSETKYNPWTGEFELTTPDAEMEYNPWSGEFHYVPKGGTDAKRSVDTCISDCTGSLPDLGVPKPIRNKKRTGNGTGVR